MNFSAEIRKQIKADCKGKVTERLGSAVGVHVLYTLPFILIMIIAIITIGISMGGSILSIAAQGDSLNYMSEAEVLQMIGGLFANLMGKMFLFAIIMIVLASVLNYGLMKYYMATERGDRPTVGTLFKPFSSGRSIWNSIKMSFCIGFRQFLWMLVPMIIYFIVVFIVAFGAGASGMPSGVGIALFLIVYVLFIIALLLITVRVFEYQAGWMLIDRDPQYGAWNATRDAAATFKGHFMDLLKFLLSFLPWTIAYMAVYVAAYLLMIMSNSALIASLACILLIIVSLIFSGFISTYEYSAFFGMFRYLSGNNGTEQTQPIMEAPASFVPQSAPAAPQVPEQPTAPAPEQPEEGSTSEESDSSEQ